MTDLDIINFEQSSALAIAEIRQGFIEMDKQLDALKIAEANTKSAMNRIREGEAVTPVITAEDNRYLEQCRALDRFFCKTRGCAEMTSSDEFEYCDRCRLA